MLDPTDGAKNHCRPLQIKSTPCASAAADHDTLPVFTCIVLVVFALRKIPKAVDPFEISPTEQI